MSVKEMDSLQTSSSESDIKKVLKSDGCETTLFRNNSHSVRILEYLQSLRKNEVLCDIRIETDDGCMTFAHKNVIMAASSYFSSMFSNYFEGSNKDIVKGVAAVAFLVQKHVLQEKLLRPVKYQLRRIGNTGNKTVNIRKINSPILQLLIDYIYSGEIMVTKENVQVLLPAANILQLDFVSNTCAEFLQKQLDASNCLGIKAFADLHNCTELLLSSEVYIKKHFLEVVKNDEFLSLSSEDVLKLISCNDLSVLFEEKVFECVIKWVNYDLDQRKDFLPQLMEHVRLPLLKPDILFNISQEPLLNNSPKCKDYVFDALQFNLQKSIQHFAIPKTIRCKRRQFGGSQKVILMFSRTDTLLKCCTEWYNSSTKLSEDAPEMIDCRLTAGLGVIRDQFVFVMGGVNQSSSKSVSMLDVSSQSPSWCPMVDMLVSRHKLGVGVLDDCIYAVGGSDGTNTLNSVEVFDVSIQKWRMVSSMSVGRFNLGVGVLNNRLYAVGGANKVVLKSVEYYDPTLDTWTPTAEMSVSRYGLGVGVLDGVIYAIGGYNGQYIKSAEAYKPSDGVWCSIADMHFSRFRPGVAVLDGLLYVIGGNDHKNQTCIANVEIYNPDTNTWTIETLSRSGEGVYGGVVVDRPSNCIN